MHKEGTKSGKAKDQESLGHVPQIESVGRYEDRSTWFFWEALLVHGYYIHSLRFVKEESCGVKTALITVWDEMGKERANWMISGCHHEIYLFM